MDIKQKFGIKVRELREKKDISQERLAELAGLDRTYISGIERGKRNVAVVNIEKVAKALGVKIKDLF
ncbi:MAG: helix-turn-helix transcriptional regulator [Candidatus Goldbacteria bacterium]|nr:helix-turn-helix transcriptional regulator [Candidatus Goldiibacteriota bacterium]